MLPSVNRTAVAVTPREPFAEWVRSQDQESQEITVAAICRPTPYLLPECDDARLLPGLLRKAVKRIFEEELEGWCTDVGSWPADRSFDAFAVWFDFRLVEMVLDVCRTALRKD